MRGPTFFSLIFFPVLFLLYVLIFFVFFRFVFFYKVHIFVLVVSDPRVFVYLCDHGSKKSDSCERIIMMITTIMQTVHHTSCSVR